MSKIIFVILLSLLILFLVIACYFLYKNGTESTQVSVISKVGSAEFKQGLDFNQGKIKFMFNPEPDMKIIKNNDNAYTIKFDSALRSYNIKYYSSKEDFINEITFTKDLDGDNAGQGCFYNEKATTLINGYSFTQVICYYNPVTNTKSGKYNPQSSSESGRDCVYQTKNNPGLLYFSGTVPVGTDICDLFLKNDIQLFEISE